MSASEPTMSIHRFSRKNGGKAKVGPLSTGSEMIAGAVVGFRSLTPIIRGKKVSSIWRFLQMRSTSCSTGALKKSASPAITIRFVPIPCIANSLIIASSS